MIITYSSMKGGVGKTTNAILTATNLAERGFKVLFFDLDTNNSGTMYFTQGIDGIADTIETHNVFESLSHNDIGRYSIPSRIENIDIVPSHLNIFKLRGIGYNELQKTLKGYEEKYDYVVIDTAPTYDNLVINALLASDIILTPLKFSSFDFTTAKFLQKQLYDDAPGQVEKWYLLYSDFQQKFANFENAPQTQFIKYFEQNFTNILPIYIPRTDAASKYTQMDMHLSTVTKSSTSARNLAIEINKLVNMLTGEEMDDETKFAERF
ncbi:MAG: AAA family ATPase [Treponema sp.]|uniref:ParA family protein n=1 Tax=Treponema sp. TaxID=166 RepID=UPI0025D07929|nr:AAA family ATPase [Treponema sp.]MBQ8680324.1 AAA family ATPase [Treponema sp.]